MRCSLKLLVPVMILAVPALGLAQQQPRLGLGTPLGQDEIKKFDFMIGPEGKELPAGHGTPTEGAAIFAKRCQVCHGQGGQGGAVRRLVMGSPGKVVRQLEPGFGTAEWGFAIGSAFWGTGVFQEGAALVLEFAFETIGAHRLEARAAVQNGRGNGALLKLGAVQEGILRKSFLRNGTYHDQVLYAIVEDDWRAIQNEDRAPIRVVVH